MRLFVAVWPPPAVVDELARLERPTKPGIRWTGPDQWHVTLAFLGEVLEPRVGEVFGAVARAVESLGGGAAGHHGEGSPAPIEGSPAPIEGSAAPIEGSPAPIEASAAQIEVSISGGPVRLGPGVLALEVVGLDEVAASVRHQLGAAGFELESRPFRAHLTLARARRGKRVPKVAGQVEGRWSLESVAVVASHLGGEGPRYETKAVISLAD